MQGILAHPSPAEPGVSAKPYSGPAQPVIPPASLKPCVRSLALELLLRWLPPAPAPVGRRAEGEIAARRHLAISVAGRTAVAGENRPATLAKLASGELVDDDLGGRESIATDGGIPVERPARR